jgi:hypothetical protein
MENKVSGTGDVYIIVEGHAHPFPKLGHERGLLFQAVARDVRFDEWEERQLVRHWFYENAVLDNGGAFVCNVIVRSARGAGQIELAGVFLPKGVDRKRVASLLRKRYGKGTALLMSDDEWQNTLHERPEHGW